MIIPLRKQMETELFNKIPFFYPNLFSILRIDPQPIACILSRMKGKKHSGTLILLSFLSGKSITLV